MTIKTEAYTVHRKLLEEKPEQYEEEVRERLLTGLPVKGYEYVEAQRVKQLAVEEFNLYYVFRSKKMTKRRPYPH
jgi:aspartyl-tRNA(Asn)/glutamyl-tRNA(Gln) amidotransferase subunit A